MDGINKQPTTPAREHKALVAGFSDRGVKLPPPNLRFDGLFFEL